MQARGRRCEPWVGEQLVGSEALGRVAPEERPHEASRSGTQRLRHGEVAPADLGEQYAGIAVVERVATHEQRVQHHPEAPAIRRTATVATARRTAQDLGADVCGAAVLVTQQVVVEVL